jgi:hypothetical protein
VLVGGFDDLVGLGLGRGWNRGQGDGADLVSRMNILAESERDLQRQRERDAEAVAPMRWRFHDGAWQRWSELDRAFAALPPPGTLLEHAAATGGPVEDEELIFDGDSWEPAGDHAEEASGSGAPEPPEAPVIDQWGQPGASPPPPPPPPPPPGPPPARDGEREAADFEAQLEAWRRRR